VKISTLLFLAGIVAVGTISTGCAGFSTQSYGSTTRGHTATEGAQRADVLANLGEPDSIYKSGDNEVLIYKGYKGYNIFGVYAKIKRDDTVVVMDKDGAVKTVVKVEVGRGSTWLAPLYSPATYPVSSEEVTEKPENYGTKE